MDCKTDRKNQKIISYDLNFKENNFFFDKNDKFNYLNSKINVLENEPNKNDNNNNLYSKLNQPKNKYIMKYFQIISHQIIY